jgi:glycerol-1-phosphatase
MADVPGSTPKSDAPEASGPEASGPEPSGPEPGAVVCCDLDGVVWRGDTPIPGSDGAIAQLRAAGRRVVFTTNNSSIPIDGYVERLAAFGIPVVADDVCTSAQAAASLVAARLPSGASVLACAGPGVVEALAARGLRVVPSGPADAVVVGFHRDFDFDGLTAAADAARGSALFVATNLDPTYPVDGGLVPGAGALAAAVATAAGREPIVAGKPERPMADLVRSRFGARGVVIGDRPSTDGAFAAQLGWPFALVLSGVAGQPGGEPIPDPAPPFVARDLARLVPLILTTR